MKNLFLFFLLFSAVICSQPGKKFRGNDFSMHLQLKPTIQVLPALNSKIELSYLYRIPYNRLIFERDGDSFKSSLRILVEVYDENELVTREFNDKHISIDDFDLAKSKSVSVQGAIHFLLADKKYTVKGIITDLNSEKEIPLNEISFDGGEYLETEVYPSIIVDPLILGCNGEELPLIVNQGDAIPFSSKQYSLIIPVADTTIKSIQVEIKSKGEELFSRTLDEFVTRKIDSKECDGRIFISNNPEGVQTNNFILSDINTGLNEGPSTIIVKSNEGDRVTKFPLFVAWENKPFSLRNPEFAIEILNYIEHDSVVAKMLDSDEEEYPKLLHEYWKQFDPTPDTKFNEIMEEFYSRIDYAAMEFRGINRKDGVSTDRGKIYIKNGKPDSVERSSNEMGYVVEIWIYKNLNKIFQFVDKQGTGNFILIES